MKTIQKSLNETITKEALYHLPKSNYSYGYNKETLHLRLRTKRNDVAKATLRIGDPYVWETGGCDGGNLNASGNKWHASNIEMKKEVETEYFDYWIVEFKPPKKRARYAFILEGKNEKILFSENGVFELKDKDNEDELSKISNFYCFPYLNEIDVPKIPKWVSKTIWYQIFPDRFNKSGESISSDSIMPWGTEPTSENFMGGNLRGIIEKLDYLCDLGINGLYFCPIFKATTNHRYDTIDYMEIDEILGTKEDFKELVEEAHKRGIKIMLDAVFNHVGYYSNEWQDVIKNGEKSKYKDWFYIEKFPVVEESLEKLDGKNLRYETFGNVPLMPKLNTENEEVINHLINVSKYWIEEMKIDGWRLDVSNEVDHVFWRRFRREALKSNSEIFILGEVWHNALPWLMGDQFDSVMNYPLNEGIKKYFIFNEIDAEKFKYVINEISVNYPKQIMENMFNLLDSHDTPRLLTFAKGNKNKMKLALTFLFTHLGTPCIYYGTEVGMEGNQGMGQEFHRRCMVWKEEKRDNEMFSFVKKLIHLRKEYSDLNKGEMEWIHAKKGDEVLVYKKGEITILLNNSEDNKKYILPSYLKNKRVQDLLSNESEKLGIEVELKGYGIKILH
ncbi:MAG: glycoside hydrolase family 13 protein [Clostridium sp.]|uniref:glycoside hydrolase family 13 protein n=1 Tax=Clostridium sp. TaxID=1506 RepID=UPI003EE72818